MKRGFSMLELAVTMALVVVLALMMVLKDYGVRSESRRIVQNMKQAEAEMLVRNAWNQMGVTTAAEAQVEMRRRQPTGELPSWLSVEAAELVGLKWEVER